MKNDKKIFFSQFLIFILCSIYDNNVCASVVSIINTTDLTQNYLKFTGFFRFFIDERYLNDLRQCDRCMMTSDVHNFYDNLHIEHDKCIGSFASCEISSKPKNLSVSVPVIDEFKHTSTSTVQVAYSCGTCICYCYPNLVERDKNNLIDSFCLDPFTVNVSRKHAIIGIQFVRVRNMITLRLLRGEVQRSSTIVRGSSTWLDPPIQCQRIAKINHNSSYFIMDNTMLPENHIVTGAAIKSCDERWKYHGRTIRTLRNCEGNFFYLTVYGTTMDNVKKGVADNFVEGTLSGPKSIKVRASLTNDDMLPSEYAGEDIPQPSGDYYVQFRTTSWNHDKGRNIIPYLNSNFVQGNPRGPLRGVGVTYSGASEYGGYISPKIHIIL